MVDVWWAVMSRVLELSADQLPMIVRLKLLDGWKEYVLLKTKQNGLLLNRKVEEGSRQSNDR
jgi:hypothetical protein